MWLRGRKGLEFRACEDRGPWKWYHVGRKKPNTGRLQTSGLFPAFSFSLLPSCLDILEVSSLITYLSASAGLISNSLLLLLFSFLVEGETTTKY